MLEREALSIEEEELETVHAFLGVSSAQIKGLEAQRCAADGAHH